jgi:hypothetical protein
MTLFDYQDGIGFYEELRPYLANQARTGRVYATGASIVSNSGLLHFLNKFKRKGSASPRNLAVGQKPETRPPQEIPCADTQELVYMLAGMMWSTGGFNGIPEHKDYP